MIGLGSDKNDCMHWIMEIGDNSRLWWRKIYSYSILGNNQGAKTDNYWLTKKTICSGTHFHIFKEIIFLSSPTRVNRYWQYWPHFLMFFTTHSIPSLTPSPDVALHAWICHTRSWKRKSDGGNLVVKIFLMSFGIKVFNKNWGGRRGGGCWKYLYSVKCHPLRYLGRCGGSDQVLQQMLRY